MTQNDKRRWENRPRFVLNDENISLEFPQQVGNCVGADKNSAANSNKQ